MMRAFTAAASTTFVLGAMRLVAVPYDIATLGVASWLLYLLVRDCAGVGAARVSVALLAASLIPTLAASPDVTALSVSPLASLSLLWWAPLIATVAVVGVGPELVRTGWFLLTWWAGCALLAIVAPAPWAALASCVETAPAAAMAGIAVARLAAVATGAARRRSVLIGALTMTCVWQAWLVLGTGRPARLLVPMLAAALMIAATDVLTDDAADQRDGIGAAVVIAMLVLGLVPGAHTLVAQQQAATTVQAPAAFVPGADSPSSIVAP